MKSTIKHRLPGWSRAIQQINGRKQSTASHFADEWPLANLPHRLPKETLNCHFVLLERWIDRRNQARARLRAIAEYGKVLDRVAAGHQKLHDNLSRFRSKDLQGEVRSIATEIGHLLDSVRTLRNSWDN